MQPHQPLDQREADVRPVRSTPGLGWYAPTVRCRFCREEMVYIHGHAACVRGTCPMFGVNQAECCDGETAENCSLSTSDVAAIVVPRDD